MLDIKQARLSVILNLFFWGILGLLLMIGLISMLSKGSIFGKFRLSDVASGSMEPAIKTGSLILTDKTENYQEGEIITFKDPTGSSSTVTHRIAGILADGKFQTKGDANNTVDKKSVSQDQVLGLVFLAIPFLGYALGFSKTLAGLIIMIIIPCTLIIYSEVLKIKNETPAVGQRLSSFFLSFRKKETDIKV